MPTNTKALQVAEPYANVAGKNLIINGDFSIWQRGTTFTNPGANTYGPDRWTIGDNTGCVYTRQASDLAGFQYFMRAFRTAGTSHTSNINVVQSIETINSIPFAGKTVTFSLYLRKGANGPSNLNIALVWGTNTDGSLWGGGGNGGSIISVSQTINTSWTRYTYTGTVPSNATQLFVWVYYSASGTSPANEYFDITGVQLELGNLATPFSRAGGGSIQDELAMCQRYYYRAASDNGYKMFGIGYAGNTSTLNVLIPFPTTMRTIPGGTDTSALSTFYWEGIAGGNSPTSVSFGGSCSQYNGQVVVLKTSGFTAGYPYCLFGNNVPAYIGFNAEI